MTAPPRNLNFRKGYGKSNFWVSSLLFLQHSLSHSFLSLIVIIIFIFLFWMTLRTEMMIKEYFGWLQNQAWNFINIHKTECPGLFMNLNLQDFHISLMFTEYIVIFLSNLSWKKLLTICNCNKCEKSLRLNFLCHFQNKN